MNNKILVGLIVFLILFEMGMCIWIIHQESNQANVCVIGRSCEEVQNTKYGSILGIKLPMIGLVAFIFLGLSLFNKKLFLILSSGGSIFSVYLIFIQLFILKQICSSCSIIDVTMLLITFAGFLYYKTNPHLDSK